MRVVIVGAGVVGLSTAYWLERRGFDVELLERGTVGSGASRGNAGEICPELATPVAKLSLIRSAVTQAYRRDSALHVNPAALPSYAKFLTGIVTNALPSRYRDNHRELSLIAKVALETFEQMASDVGIPVDHGGYLHVYDTYRAAKEGRAGIQARLSASLGERRVGPILSSAELAATEPCLTPSGYGFLYEDGAFVNPDAFVDRLWEHLSRLGVQLHNGVTATRVSDDGTGGVVHTDRGEFHAQAIVVCAGIGSGQIAAASGHAVPIRSGKGYSFTIDPSPTPRHVIKFESAHVALLPLGQGARIAGTMEFDLDPNRFNPKRIDQIVSALRPHFHDGVFEARTNEWVGARPLTPDGLPIIGRFPHLRHAHLASGHNMLGLMLSPITGKLVADGLTDDGNFEPQQFRLSRF